MTIENFGNSKDLDFADTRPGLDFTHDDSPSLNIEGIVVNDYGPLTEDEINDMLESSGHGGITPKMIQEMSEELIQMESTGLVTSEQAEVYRRDYIKEAKESMIHFLVMKRELDRIKSYNIGNTTVH